MSLLPGIVAHVISVSLLFVTWLTYPSPGLTQPTLFFGFVFLVLGTLLECCSAISKRIDMRFNQRISNRAPKVHLKLCPACDICGPSLL